MAFDEKELKAALKPIQGERSAHFLFTDKDSDQQPFLLISKAPIKGSAVAAKRKEAQGKVYIGKVRLHPEDGVYVFRSKQTIPEGRFDKALKLIAKKVRALAGARLEADLEQSGEEGREGQTEVRTDAVGFDVTRLPLELRLNEGFSKKIMASYALGRELEQADQALRQTESRTTAGAREVLELEDLLEKMLQETPAYASATEKVGKATQEAGDAVDRYMDAADALDRLEEQRAALEQGRDILALTEEITRREKQLSRGEGSVEELEELRKKQKALRQQQSEALEEVKKKLLSQQEQVQQLEEAARLANEALDEAEQTQAQAREKALQGSRMAGILQMNLDSANQKLDDLVKLEDAAATQVLEKRARLTEAQRQIQAEADKAQSKEFLDQVDREFTADNQSSRSLEVRRKSKGTLTPRLLGLLQEKDVSTVAERLAQMGTTPEEYRLSLAGDEEERAPSKPIPTGPGPKKVSDEQAQQEMAQFLGGLSQEEKTALADFQKYGGDWKKVKEAAATSSEAMATMKVVRKMRNQFMDDALKQTSARVMDTLKEQLAGGLGDSEELRDLLKGLEPVELDPRDPSKDAVYADGRKRRYQLRFPEGPLRDRFGETLTLQYFAPGSTNPTSDIDMQFICEESPTACTGMIEMFRTVCQERLQGVEAAMNSVLSKELGETPMKLGTLAQTFDTNPYPAGFVNRQEQRVGEHFSDTFTQRSVVDKKIADVGLALIRTLESPLDPETDPVEALLKEADALQDTGAAIQARRALTVGVSISLCSQQEQAAALLKQSPWPESLHTLQNTLREALEEARSTYGTPDVATAWQGESPPDKTLKGMQAAARRLQGLMHEISAHGDGEGGALVSEARYAAFLASQQQVERLTRARDLALSAGAEKVEASEGCVTFATQFERATAILQTEGLPSGEAQNALRAAIEKARTSFDRMRGSLLALPDDIGQHTAALEKAIQEMRRACKKEGFTLQKPEPGEKTRAMERMRDDELERMRAATSSLGVSAFLLQGMALNNADEAYTSRGAIGLVVEKDQIGREIVATTGTAISSLESNAGFFHEHVREERAHGINVDTPVEDTGSKKKLTEFCVGTAKYVERITKAFRQSDPLELSEALPGVDLSWLAPLTQGLLALKDGRHPDSAKIIADKTDGPPIEDVCTTFLARYQIRSIGDLQKKMLLIEQQARQTLWAQEVVGKTSLSQPLIKDIQESFLNPEDPSWR